MKGLKWIFFSLILFISFAFTTPMTNAFADEPEKPITIQVVARFSESDETNLNQISANYADEITVNVDGYEGIEFAYWILNNKIRNFPKDHKFIATENQTITALFAEEGYHVVVFINANGDVLEVDWVEDGKDATAPDTSELSLPGYVFDGWDKELTGITSNTIVVAQFEKVSEEEFELTVVNGKILGTDESTDTIGYNEVVTVVADDAPTGKVFSHWQVGHRVVSTQPTYKFTMLQDLRIEAVYANEPMADNPLVTISRKIYLNDKPTYYGQFYLPEGYTRIEYGFIMSDDLGEITLETPDIEKKQILNFFSKTNEFIITFSSSDPLNVRTYLVYKDTEGNLGTVYSDLLMDLFISEYGESGSAKWIEIYNPTNQSINLNQYVLKLFSNGRDESDPQSSYTFTGTIKSNEVFVICYGNVGNKCNITHNVANFSGDDAFGLYKNNVLIDQFGVIGEQKAWPITDDYTTDNVTLVRKVNIIGPNPLWDNTEWEPFDLTFDFIGFHLVQLVEPESITIIDGPDELIVGNSITLTAMVYPVLSDQRVIWSSSDPNIATVDENGTVTAIAPGNVTITATSKVNNEVSYSVNIIVNEPTELEYKETFDNIADSDLNNQQYRTFTFVGINNITWEVTKGRTHLDAYGIDGKGVIIRGKEGKIKSINQISGGISKFSVDLKQAFSGTSSEIKVALYINDELIAEHALSGKQKETFTVDNLNITGNFVLEIRYTGNNENRITIDNITWTPLS